MPEIVIDIKNTLIILTAVVHLVLGLLVLRQDRREKPNVLFSLLELSLLSWAISMVFYRSAETVEASLWWVCVLYASAIFIPWVFIYFVDAFSGKKLFTKFWQHIIVAGFPFFLLKSIVLDKTFIQNVLFTTREKIIIFNNSLHLLYALYISGYFLFAYIILFYAYKASSGIKKIQLKYILVGTLVSTIIGAGTNLILPLFGIFALNWVGQVAISILAIAITYAIFKHSLLNTKLIAIELFTALIIFVLLVDIFFANTPRELFSKMGILIAVAFFGKLIVNSALKEIESREQIEKLAKDLQTANDELARVSQAKSDFLSIASHQLKTPLSIIKGYLSLITEGSFGRLTKKMKDPLQRIYISNERLISLVEDLLNLSRIEDGRMKYDMAKANLVEVVTSVYEEFKDQAKQRNIKFIWKPTKTPVFSNIDKVKIRNVVFNLVDNAIKYTEQGSIAITLKTENGKVLVEVTDTGIGIARDHLDRLFAKFTRLSDGNRNFAISGFGLGLYITKLIVKDHNGRIWADSPGLGKGSTFSLELPLG
ncbi:MAG: hypothetical protein A2756_04690 [Candidatus Ryanbacteria bacterium RIFCSPHIGHO2_01_FULL_48_27]|uniref:histidine kinase n=1 Tax=Candidatus Ryanbacteria bacterium RIFCSPHIGHO2_01_FULL_48_27 TaxID=1802115 RepID=A0A1G2G363_9BACT|nr:MAG: hypothetical protein A2756_04690 [Candidatus Ryanbacteria bacterium RIFCSPHIGHO2_01_FULL_48_27]